MFNKQELETLQHITMLDISTQRQENLDAMRRRKMSRRASKRNFKNGSRTNSRNFSQRGGYRL